mmetsp:Transcript_65853/g.214274  ORF Transcript_65853/g.214274 Transcript_65853/m.214274 type:complete len:360 (-) Transcript_65853:1642-2721(-)
MRHLAPWPHTTPPTKCAHVSSWPASVSFALPLLGDARADRGVQPPPPQCQLSRAAHTCSGEVVHASINLLQKVLAAGVAREVSPQEGDHGVEGGAIAGVAVAADFLATSLLGTPQPRQWRDAQQMQQCPYAARLRATQRRQRGAPHGRLQGPPHGRHQAPPLAEAEGAAAVRGLDIPQPLCELPPQRPQRGTELGRAALGGRGQRGGQQRDPALQLQQLLVCEAVRAWTGNAWHNPFLQGVHDGLRRILDPVRRRGPMLEAGPAAAGEVGGRLFLLVLLLLLLVLLALLLLLGFAPVLLRAGAFGCRLRPLLSRVVPGALLWAYHAGAGAARVAEPAHHGVRGPILLREQPYEVVGCLS